MTDRVIERAGVPVLLCGDDGPPIAEAQDALGLIGAAGPDADVVAVPVGRFAAGFFDLRTGLAGEVMQEFVNYRVRLAIVGDVSAHVAASRALRDLVTESHRGRHIWFVPALDGLDASCAGESGRRAGRGGPDADGSPGGRRAER